MNANLSLKKLTLIEWLSQVQDEAIVNKIEAIRKKMRIKTYEAELKPMSAKALQARAKKANEDIAAGRVFTTEQLEKESENW